jgi:hypothetical protein
MRVTTSLGALMAIGLLGHAMANPLPLSVSYLHCAAHRVTDFFLALILMLQPALQSLLLSPPILRATSRLLPLPLSPSLGILLQLQVQSLQHIPSLLTAMALPPLDLITRLFRSRQLVLLPVMALVLAKEVPTGPVMALGL